MAIVMPAACAGGTRADTAAPRARTSPATMVLHEERIVILRVADVTVVIVGTYGVTVNMRIVTCTN
jgi:hypothetical protein